MRYIDKYFVVSLLIWLAATLDAIGGLMGRWSVLDSERFVVLLFEALLLICILANAYSIKNWVYRNSTRTSHRAIGWLVVAAVALCVCGDLVNFNLDLNYYRHSSVIKHDYLADSVWFFAPGYFLLLVVACWMAIDAGFKRKLLSSILAIAAIIGGLSFYSMHLPGSGLYVSVMTGIYAVLITLVGASGLVLSMALLQSPARLVVLLVSFGLILAMLADAVIGQLWIYGNQGEGFFPMARYLNWPLYIGSQCLVIHLARINVWRMQGASAPQ